MTELGSDELRLLAALRADEAPTQADRERVRARVATAIAVGAGAATAAAAQGARAAGSFGSWGQGVVTSTVLKWGAGVVALGGALLGALALTGLPSAAPTGPASAPTAHPSAAPGGATSSAARASGSSARGAPPPMARPAATGSAPSPGTGVPGRAAPRGSDIDGELKLIAEAQRALKAGSSEQALAALDRHAKEHPDGALAVERAGVRAVALCEAGRSAEGRQAAQAFLGANPRSPLAERVRAACFQDR